LFSESSNDSPSLEDIQKIYKTELILAFVTAARERYLRAVRLVGVETRLGRIIRISASFDPLIFDEIYEIMAAYFRNSFDVQMPLPLFWDKETHPVGRLWRQFFEKDIAVLIDYDEVVVNTLIAAYHPKEKTRTAAKELLVTWLAEHYRNKPSMIYHTEDLFHEEECECDCDCECEDDWDEEAAKWDERKAG